jgi:hypothetical protein
MSVNFKTLENITPIDPDKISRKKHFHVYKQAVWKIALKNLQDLSENHVK